MNKSYIALLLASMLCFSSCSDIASENDENLSDEGSSIISENDLLSQSETEVSKPETDSFPEMLKPYVGHRSSEYDTDFDRMMADVANLTADDREIFFDDFESFDDSKFSGFLLFSGTDADSSEGGWSIKKYLYGPYMLNLSGTKDIIKDGKEIETDRQLNVFVERPVNLFQSGYLYPYVELRLFAKDGTDLPVESHTKEEIDRLAQITEADIMENPKYVGSGSRSE